MPVSTDQFWKLVRASKLLTEQKYETLQERYQEMRGAAEGRAHPRAVAMWLISERALTHYQAQVLLSGRPGPFAFGEYRVGERIQGPPDSHRFDGVHLPTNHPVMLHFWRASADEWPAARLLVEKHRNVTHPHLDRCYETREAAGQRFAVTENVEGRPLAKLIKSKPMPAAEAVPVAYQMAQALQQIHAAQLVHAGVTPDDILIAVPGQAKLRRLPLISTHPIDFTTPDPKSRRLRQADYLAPERRRADQPANALSDIYGLGCVLYELLTGQPPFPGGSLSEKMNRHASEPIRPPEEFGLMPSGLTEVVSFMMAKQPSLRYQNAAEVAQRLEAFLASSPHVVPPRPRSTEPFFLAHIQKKNQRIPTHLQQQADTAERLGTAAAGGAVKSPRSVAETPPDVGVHPVVPAQSKKRQTSISPVMLTIAAIGIVVVISTTALLLNLSADRDRAATPRSNPADVSRGSQPRVSGHDRARDDAPPGLPEGGPVDDDGNTLWMSPTQGQPITVDFAPPASQCFVFVRPQAILERREGGDVLKALGPGFEEYRGHLNDVLGISLQQIDSLLVALVPQDAGPPRATQILRLSSMEALDSVIGKADDVKQVDGGRRLKLGTGEAFLPNSESAIVVAGTGEDLAAIIAQSGRAPLLKRQVEQLRLMTDDLRHLTILLDPRFIASDGRDAFGGEFALLREPILRFLGDHVQAVILSMHLDNSFYGELVLSPTLDQNPISLASACQSRLKQLPEELNAHLGRILIERFWQPLAMKFPLMINYLYQQTRIGVVDNLAMINFALPEQAAHNLTLASVLAVEASAISDSEQVPIVGQAADWDTILTHRMDLEIPQLSLEFSMRDLALAVAEAFPNAGFGIEIVGADLQLDGITRNQQIRDVRLLNQPLDEILTELVRRGNPKVAPSVGSPEQKLVWVSSPNGRTGKTVLITTRDAAARKGYSLPRQFLENPP